jgi:hypothetical protein
MPHEFESGVFTEGKAAWHGLGTVLPNDALDSAERRLLQETQHGVDRNTDDVPVPVGGPTGMTTRPSQ